MLFLRECFRESSKLTIMNGKYRIPDIHPYSAKVLDLLDRMLTVVPEGRASIEEVIECIVAIQEGISLPARRIMTMQLTGTTRNTGGSLEFVAGGIPRSIEVDSSNAPEDEEGKDPDEASESYTYYYTKALSDSAALTLCRSNNGSDTTGSSAIGGSLPEFATGDDSASDDTQWLEFQPGKPNHTARGQTARNKQRKSGTKKKRRHDTSMDPLSLGNTESTRKKSNETDKIQSDWALGVLNRLSSKSLTPIEPERSVDDRTDDGGFTVLKPSSHRKFTLNKVSKKRSGKSMSSAASMFLDTSSSASLLEKSMGMSDFGKKCATSSANLDGYSGDDSAWGFDSSAQHESSNFFSDSDVDDLDLLPSDFVNSSPLFPPTPKDSPDSPVGPAPSVESSLLSMINATLETVKVPSIRSLDMDKSFVATAELDASGYNGDISQSMSKALQVSISQTEANTPSILTCDISQSMSKALQVSMSQAEANTPSMLTCDISQSTSKSLQGSISQAEANTPSMLTCDIPRSTSKALQAIILQPEENVQSTLASQFSLNNTSLRGILEEPISQKNESDESATVEYSYTSQMNDIPLPDDFPFSTGDANSAPFNHSDNLAVERICLDVISSTRNGEHGLYTEVKSKSKRKTDKGDVKAKVSSKKATASPRIRKEKVGHVKGSSESRLNTQSPVSVDRNLEREASVGSKSTWDDFFGGRLDDSFSASKEGSSGPIGSSRSGGRNETRSSVMKAKENIKKSPPSRNDKTIDTWQYSSPKQWASQQRFKSESLPDTNAIKATNTPSNLVYVDKLKGGNKRKTDPQAVRKSSDGKPIDLFAVKKWVKDTTGKSTYGSLCNGERPPELTPVEEHGRITDGSDSAEVSPQTELENRRKRGSLDTFLARENAIAEFQEFIDYQEVVKYTEVKKDPVAECKVSVGADDKKGSVVLSDAQKKYANASASSVFTPQYEKQRVGGASRSVFSANELMWYKNGLQSTSHRLLESEIGQVLIPTDDEHEDETRKRGTIQSPLANNTGTALLSDAKVAPTQSTLHRETSKVVERGSPYGPKATSNIHETGRTSDGKLVSMQSSMQREESKMTIDSNLPPPEEVCVAEISRPPGHDSPLLSPTGDNNEQAQGLLVGDVTDLDSERAKIESNAYKRFQRSKYRLDDNQPFSKLFSHRITEQALAQSGKAENLLGSPEEYYSDDESEDFGIPLEIEIIPDHALSSPKSPKSKRKKTKAKKSRRKGSMRQSEYTNNELDYSTSGAIRGTTEERGISMHSLHTRKK